MLAVVSVILPTLMSVTLTGLLRVVPVAHHLVVLSPAKEPKIALPEILAEGGNVRLAPVAVMDVERPSVLMVTPTKTVFVN